jgi:xylan 1,4-beta-xylosidase
MSQRRATPSSTLLAAFGALGIGSSAAQMPSSAPAPIEITVSASEAGTPFPHFWESMFGSGEAVLALRDNYRKDLRAVKAITDLKYVRFHAIFHDAIGLYDEDKHGKAVYNFSYVDQIYDGLLAAGVKPFVELSFMPKKLAKDPRQLFGFWYTPVISPPKDYARWNAMLEAFVRHLIERYGIDEVASWYFEVWNEPNIGFWGGTPYKPTYYELYDQSARTLKNVSERLRVGGPATAQAGWVGDFIEHVHRNGVPADFVSSHVYSNDLPQNVLGNKTPVAREQMVCRAVRKNHDEIKASAMPSLPLIYSEYNASFANEPNITDTVYMGPWLATTISQCDGLVDAMSYWTFSDVFEEGGVPRTPFYGGFGLIATHGIPKPSFNAFTLLHKLGEERLKVNSDSALATKRADGAIVLALWNYAPPDATGKDYKAPGAPGPEKKFVIRLNGAPAGARAKVWRVDRDHGNVIRRFDEMGRPPFPTRAQLDELRAAAQLDEPQNLQTDDAGYGVLVPSHGLALVEIK